MAVEGRSIDKVMLLGLAVTFVGLRGFDFLVYRESRIMRGLGLGIEEIFSTRWNPLMAMVGILLLCTWFATRDSRVYAWAAAGAWVLVLAVFFATGRAASISLIDADPVARVSLGGGFWLALGGVWIVWGRARWRMKQRSVGRLLNLLLAVIVGALLLAGHFNDLSILREYFSRQGTFTFELYRHMVLAFTSVFTGSLVGLSLAMWMMQSRKAERVAGAVVNLFQTVPTLSFLGLLMLPLAYVGTRIAPLRSLGISGVGWAPAFVVLVAYTLLPITANALTGFRWVDAAVLDAATGMGMTERQQFWRIRLPLAMPVILSGIRTALTQAIGNTILAGLIGGGGMGTLIFLGLAQAAPDLILLGTLPVVVMALLADQAMHGLTGLVCRNTLEEAT